MPDLESSLAKIIPINSGLARRFPGHNSPFHIMTRLLEESGELAKEVNHFEGTGIKKEKYGDPDRAKFAKEVQDVLRCTLQIAAYYRLEEELAQSIDNSFYRMKEEGWIE